MADHALIGGCLCGQIRYRIAGEPAFVSQCCCKDCQKATGTGHTTILGIRAHQLSLTGELATYTNAGETGGKVTRHFCGTCGGRIYTSGDLPGDMIMVQAGSLDDPGQVTPINAIYVKDRVHWDKLDPAIPQFEGMPATPTG